MRLTTSALIIAALIAPAGAGSGFFADGFAENAQAPDPQSLDNEQPYRLNYERDVLSRQNRELEQRLDNLNDTLDRIERRQQYGF
jgi:hypothetical protein